MGGAIAQRLVAAGYPLTVWNRSREKLAPALAEGAVEAARPAEVANSADIVLLCLTDDTAVEQVVFGDGGIAESGTPDKLVVDFSTIRPAQCRRIAERLELETGMRWIDAPVTGGKSGAEAGRLVIMAGGQEIDIERVRPIMATISQSFVRLGPQGMGLVTKLCNQLVNACNKVVLSEMLLLARAGGIDPACLPAVLKGGSADAARSASYGCARLREASRDRADDPEGPRDHCRVCARVPHAHARDGPGHGTLPAACRPR
jgi:3-hydroxyisobutyrate dehydrogenase